jgi:hypothetical protein
MQSVSGAVVFVRAHDVSPHVCIEASYVARSAAESEAFLQSDTALAQSSSNAEMQMLQSAHLLLENNATAP